MADQVVSPAYDAMTVEQRKAFRLRHPHSYLHVTRTAEDEHDADTVDQATLVARGRASLEAMLAKDLFLTYGEPAFYIYRLVKGAHAQIGLICEISSDYYAGIARPHEATRPDRTALLAEHFETVRAASSPISCAVRDDGSLERELDSATDSQPVLDVLGDDGLQQTVWRVHDYAAHARLVERLADEPLFIIDGHHRSAANEHLREQNKKVPVLAAVFPEQSLHLAGFHRLVRLPQAVRPSEIASMIQRRFAVEQVEPLDAVEPGTTAFVVDGVWHLVRFDERPIAGGPQVVLGSLDPVVLEREIFDALLEPHGPIDVATVPDADPFAEIAQLAEAQNRVPFFVAPVAIDDMMAVAEGGLMMPPKSTYFTPKVRSGVFLRLLDAELRGDSPA